MGGPLGPLGRIKIVVWVFGRFSIKVGPKTPLERRGSSCSAGCTKKQGAPEGPRRGPGGARRALRAPEGPPRGPGGALRAPEGPRRGPPVFRHVEVGFCPVSTFCFKRILTVFKHVEVGSSPKEPDFDLFARVGRRGGRIYDLCSAFQNGAVGHAPGPNFGPNPGQNREKLKYIF